LTAWNVKDAPELLAQALKITAGDHTIAAVALELSLATPNAKARELAVLYAKFGQPPVLRSSAIGAFGQLAKDDPTLHDMLVELSNDPDRSVRQEAWMMVRQLKVKKAIPVLEERLRGEHLGFGGIAREMLEATINELKGQGSTPKGTLTAGAAATTIAELEKQVAELQKKSKELASQIADLKQKGNRSEPATKSEKGASSSSGSH
jgi:hypothetical protein